MSEKRAEAQTWRACALGSLGQYDNIPQSEWLITDRKLLFTVLEAGKPEIRGPGGQVSHCVLTP